MQPRLTPHAVRHRCTVRAHQILPGGYRKLVLEAKELALQARAGHFVHLLPRHEVSSAPLLRRAFSIMQAADGEIELLYRPAGRGTTLMAEWQINQQVNVLGPLGRSFPLPQDAVLLVGGGVGVPPLLMLAAQTRRESSEKPLIALIGARSREELIGENDFEALGATVRVATDDGSSGHHGYVTEILDQMLASSAMRYSIYSCGPLPMLRQVASVCARHGQRALLSLEENMPCGFGVCNGCAFPVHSENDLYRQYVRICVEGPGIWSDVIDWEKVRI